MAKVNKVYFYRAADEASLPAIASLQRTVSEMLPDFDAVRQPHVTICDIRFHDDALRVSREFKGLAETLLHHFDSPSKPVEWARPQYIDGHLSHTALVIDLGENPFFRRETAKIVQAIRSGAIDPTIRSGYHITLGYIDPSLATQGLLKMVSKLMGETNSTVFNPLQHDLRGQSGINNVYLGDMITAARDRRNDAERIKQNSTRPPLIDTAIRHHTPHTFPLNFLRSLRPDSDNTERASGE